MKEGIVVETTGSWYEVKLTTGQTVQARLKGKFRLSELKVTNPIAVGDRVMVGNTDDDESIVITSIKERKNKIIRQSPRKKRYYQIIAANIDQALVVASMRKPKTKKGFLSRLFVGLEYYQIKPIVVFNKHDIYEEKHLKEFETLQQEIEAIGYSTLVTSATAKLGVEDLKQVCKEKLSVLTGPSGVGKSSLLNQLNPSLQLKTKQVSNYNEKGQHTTTFARMHEIAENTYIIDTPGIKEYGVAEIDAYELSFYFPEMKDKLQNCKFNNCQHINEPKCAIVEAVEAGEITTWRYQSYLQIREELLIENKPYL